MDPLEPANMFGALKNKPGGHRGVIKIKQSRALEMYVCDNLETNTHRIHWTGLFAY